jgi:erythromycin esterase
MRSAVLALSFFLSVASSAVAAPKPYLDLDFEQPECTSEWYELSSWRWPYENRLDTSGGQSGQQSFRVRYTSQAPWAPAAGYGGMYRVFPMNEVAGKHLKLSGYIRTEAVSLYAGFWIQVNNQDGSVAFVDMSEQWVTGTTPWTRYEVELDVPATARDGYFGFEFPGTGTAWFDNLSLEIDGKAIKQGKPDLLVPTPGHVNSVRRQAIPFTTAVAGNGFDDLWPLEDVLGDARIVSLGEATHGTKEFFQMKHRLLEFLVTEMGFTHFSIEANMPETYKVNQYVLTGQGDPAELLEGMLFWTWNTQEVLDMIHWVRAYNASGRGPVQFTGFDAQFSSGAADNLQELLTVADPAYLATVTSTLARFRTLDQTWQATAADRTAARGLYDHISGRRSVYLATHSAEQVDWMIQNARVIVQVIELMIGVTPRDQSMAENVGWILDHAPAGSKIVLWAHNGHVAKTPGWMGKYLDDRYGDDMYVLGFTLGEGRYNAISAQGLTSHQAHPPVKGSLETLFQATGMPRFILDLRRNSGLAKWFREPRLMQSHGAVAYQCAFYPTVVSEDYDGLIWIDPTSPSELLPFD